MQIDMFAVELGAALLLQFRTEGGIIRILADAGFEKYRVVDKLQGAIRDFSQEGSLKIDLMIGTHYDSDHLDGLVAVVNDHNFDISEAWLPPVADDTKPHSSQQLPTDDDLLALNFKREGKSALDRYVSVKARQCDQLAEAERLGDKVRQHDEEIKHREFNPSSVDLPGERLSRRYFELHALDAELTIGAGHMSHADESIVDPREATESIDLDILTDYWPSDIKSLAETWLNGRTERAAIEAKSLAYLRKATAKDAITAISLANVVEALKKRDIPIRCSTIKDGQPRHFSWDAQARRFSPVVTAHAEEPRLTLLGPSDGLVKNHWDKLPIGTYAKLAMRSLLPIEGITPSNQLSYIMVLERDRQRILISGDAGCVDFSPGKNQPYYAELLRMLSPLHVVQVAHHAGRNAHFYNCLLQSSYPTQDFLSYLLLSHKTRDESRPSELFSKFVEELGKTPNRLQLLFTSLPAEAKVRDVKSFIGNVAGGVPNDSGDIRLRYHDNKWQVTKHSIRV